ncbi:unnamed protein product (macronuclear) [Paramecium tetraurelia]|uniref:Uncharacterized protein n=1 Tax=Paramecium tetraurelia TaxID=5888 RepID=A0C722_PARTE|nr:uncharacterized protein GSPATT00035719001 [Paramecium tetraurelia]CAK66589.1 unnamed protein product [Paramecium tetraurelia]|eukprot:XP_001433986.1 hypothetical protein (macronuclear) [Paramecium tetraurelia strain d4-2]
MTEQIQLNLGCNKIIWESHDRKERIYELRQVARDANFVKFYWVKGAGQRTLRKGKWYCFTNYKIVHKILRPILNCYSKYRRITKLEKEELKVERMRDPYSNILGIIQDVGHLDQFSRQFPFRFIEVLLGDGNTVVQIFLKNDFATEKIEKFQKGEIIYIHECKKNINPQTKEIWYSTLTKNTKIKFYLQTIRQHVRKDKFEEILKLKSRLEFQDEATGQIE